MKTTVPFQGFYNTIHDSQCDDTLERMLSDSSGCHPVREHFAEKIFDHVDWHKVHLAYAQEYVENLAHKYKIALKWEKMISPREYNFTTDRLFADITQKEVRRIYKLVDKERFHALIKQEFTSRDGFMSYYPNSIDRWPPIPQWDWNHVGTLIAAYVEQVAQEERGSDGFDQFAEYGLMEDSFSNGFMDEELYKALDAEGRRIADVANYLRRREERQYATHQG